MTIDGPAGAGKSTVARRLASRLVYEHLDTGALYRAVAWKVRTAGVAPNDAQAVAALLLTIDLAVEQRREGMRVSINHQDVTDEIRTPEITLIASQVSTIPAVREWLLPVQRRMGAQGGMVAEGRDLGTRVFPKADVKFFLDADMTTRASRRQRDLTSAGQAQHVARTQQEMEDRDQRDRSREVAPLIPAADAEVIDSSTLTVDQVVDHMMRTISSKL